MSRQPTEKRRKPRMATALAAAVILTLAACTVTHGGSLKVGSAPYEQGSGRLTTETRPLDDFHAVSATRGVEVLVTTGSSPAATVTADDNLLAHVSTTVASGTLMVAIEGSIETSNPLKVEVTTVSPIDTIAADAGSSVDLEDLHPAALTVRASSGASVRAGGRADSLEVAANAGAIVDLRNVEIEQARVNVSAGSTVHVHASDAVRGSCTLGSTLRLHGTPVTVDVETDGGSTVGG